MGTGMRMAVVVHGPEAVDSGLALEVIRRAAMLGDVRARVGGATAVAAVIDSGLEDVIAHDSRELPSTTIRQMAADADVVVLVNYGKDRDSALGFGRLVMAKVLPISAAVVQVDNGLSIIWSADDPLLPRILPLMIGEVLDLRGSVETIDLTVRRLSGVRNGEFVWINGHVIGRALRDEVVLSQTPSGELRAEGLTIKPTGVERLGDFDIRTAIVRSGQVRRTSSRPRSLRSLGSTVCIIDHCAEESVFRCRDASYVITVGDDTSKIASALLFRLGIPVIAITDGDEDGISKEEIFYPGSFLFRLEPGNDDLVGAEIKERCFVRADRIPLSMKIEEMAALVRTVSGKRLLWERVF
ncbi:MAG: DUF2117 domain-containing protein [Methanomassiliicoccus sp.]|nr:MAG: DUF2117 domain-containing protein [Methanomassiliicoccus sp.]